MRIVDIPIEKIYVPAKLRKELDEEKILPLAEEILKNGLQKPIYVRQGKGRYVLVSGLHRLEATKFLDETSIEASIVQARKA